MKITICETAGLCAGAMRAYMSVVDSLKTNKNVAVYKEILHNENLISDLKNKGAIFHDNLSEFKKDDFVILRAHGEEKSIYEYLEKNGNRYFDSICHNVKNVRDISIKKEKEGFNIIVVGKCKNGKCHDEVLGLVSFLTTPIVVSSIDEAQRIHFEQGKKYFAVCQTTYPAKLFEEIIETFSKNARKSKAVFEYKNTICSFTAVNNQKSKELARVSDIAIVVGSTRSSNTIELYESVKDICHTVFANDIEEIIYEVKKRIDAQNIPISKVKICILAGASTLKKNLKNIQNRLVFELK